MLFCEMDMPGRNPDIVLAGATAQVQEAVESAKAAGRLVGEKNIKTAVVIYMLFCEMDMPGRNPDRDLKGIFT